MNENKKNYENLANAIVAKGCRDYRDSLKYNNHSMEESCERFFKSDWFRTLTNLSADFLMREIKRNVGL